VLGCLLCYDFIEPLYDLYLTLACGLHLDIITLDFFHHSQHVTLVFFVLFLGRELTYFFFKDH